MLPTNVRARPGTHCNTLDAPSSLTFQSRRRGSCVAKFPGLRGKSACRSRIRGNLERRADLCAANRSAVLELAYYLFGLIVLHAEVLVCAGVFPTCSGLVQTAVVEIFRFFE